MKKLIKVLIIILCFMCLSCKNNNEIISDGKKFKEEYEEYNSSTTQDGQEYVKMDINENNVIKYASIDDVMNVLDGTGIILFGFPECPWCRNAIPVLLEAADIVGVETIYYYNNVNDRDIKSLDSNGNIINEKEGSKEYYQILEKLGDKASIYEGLNDNSIKRIYYPTVVFTFEGEIVGTHVSTVESQTSPFIPLSDNEKNELINIYSDYMHKVLNDLCDATC